MQSEEFGEVSIVLRKLVHTSTASLERINGRVEVRRPARTLFSRYHTSSDKTADLSYVSLTKAELLTPGLASGYISEEMAHSPELNREQREL